MPCGPQPGIFCPHATGCIPEQYPRTESPTCHSPCPSMLHANLHPEVYMWTTSCGSSQHGPRSLIIVSIHAKLGRNGRADASACSVQSIIDNSRHVRDVLPGCVSNRTAYLECFMFRPGRRSQQCCLVPLGPGHHTIEVVHMRIQSAAKAIYGRYDCKHMCSVLGQRLLHAVRGMHCFRDPPESWRCSWRCLRGLGGPDNWRICISRGRLLPLTGSEAESHWC